MITDVWKYRGKSTQRIERHNLNLRQHLAR
ncbi:hypothetical protein, partial [Shigella boydii]